MGFSDGEEGDEPGSKVVDFGFNFGDKKVGGRRSKIFKAEKKKLRSGTFDSMGLSVPTLRAIKRKGYRLPTPIQRRAMPLIMQASRGEKSMDGMLTHGVVSFRPSI